MAAATAAECDAKGDGVRARDGRRQSSSMCREDDEEEEDDDGGDDDGKIDGGCGGDDDNDADDDGITAASIACVSDSTVTPWLLSPVVVILVTSDEIASASV